MYSVCIYTLLKVVSYYDVIVLSMSVMGFPNFFRCALSKFFLGFLEFFKLYKATYDTSYLDEFCITDIHIT